jgi:hypothetical protein
MHGKRLRTTRVRHGRNPDLNIVRAQAVGLLGANDEKLLEWAADNDRVLVTHE